MKAFDTLITKYKNPIANTIYRITWNRDGAEDLAQEVFLRVFRARKTYKAKAKFATWLFHIVRNIAYDDVRNRKKHKNITTFTNGYDKKNSENKIKSTLPGPEAMIRAVDLDRDLKKALELLSLNQRTAIVFSRIKGMTYVEIAKILDISESAVKMLVKRAKIILSKELADYI